jgi:four helix bundle protein
MRNYTTYPAYRQALALSKAVLKASKQFPPVERYELTSQLRRAAISLPSNIAEGAGRTTSAAFAQFLAIALGLLNEVRTQLELADSLGYISPETKSELSPLCEATRISLVGPLNALKGGVPDHR